MVTHHKIKDPKVVRNPEPVKEPESVKDSEPVKDLNSKENAVKIKVFKAVFIVYTPNSVGPGGFNSLEQSTEKCSAVEALENLARRFRWLMGRSLSQ